MKLSLSLCLLALGVLGLGSNARAADDQGAQGAFKASCSSCHAADGSGRTPTGKALQVPDLRSADAQKLSDSQLTDIITNGKNGKMPPFGSTLDSDKIQALVKYIRKFAQDGKSSGGAGGSKASR